MHLNYVFYWTLLCASMMNVVKMWCRCIIIQHYFWVGFSMMSE